jgi:hypothetical protein
VYYSWLEAIQNASKHGGPAATITVSLCEHSDELTLRVTDDGPGVDPSNVQSGAACRTCATASGRSTVVTQSSPRPPRAPRSRDQCRSMPTAAADRDEPPDTAATGHERTRSTTYEPPPTDHPRYGRAVAALVRGKAPRDDSRSAL